MLCKPLHAFTAGNRFEVILDLFFFWMPNTYLEYCKIIVGASIEVFCSSPFFDCDEGGGKLMRRTSASRAF